MTTGMWRSELLNTIWRDINFDEMTIAENLIDLGMTLAGHSIFSTTHGFYLAVADDLVDRARQVSKKVFGTRPLNAMKNIDKVFGSD
jgi:hypothetical protein